MVAGVLDIIGAESLRISLELTLSIFPCLPGLLHCTATNVVKEPILFVLLDIDRMVDFLELLVQFLKVEVLFDLRLLRLGFKGLSRNLTLRS